MLRSRKTVRTPWRTMGRDLFVPEKGRRIRLWKISSGPFRCGPLMEIFSRTLARPISRWVTMTRP
jgi:hypothetical protein